MAPPPPPPGRGGPPPQSTGGRDSGWGARGGQQGQGRSWEEAPTPRSERGSGGSSYGGGSARVPNRGWDETPNARASGSRGESSGGPRGWEATPRTERGGSVRPDFTPNQHEWEEEQVRLDRDWYEQDDVVCAGLSVLQPQCKADLQRFLAPRPATRTITPSPNMKTLVSSRKRSSPRRRPARLPLARRNTYV